MNASTNIHANGAMPEVTVERSAEHGPRIGIDLTIPCSGWRNVHITIHCDQCDLAAYADQFRLAADNIEKMIAERQEAAA